MSVGKFVGAICKLLGDANSQVSCCYGDYCSIAMVTG